jgi:hypothetical protein
MGISLRHNQKFIIIFLQVFGGHGKHIVNGFTCIISYFFAEIFATA